MGQFSMEIYALTGSLLSGNLHLAALKERAYARGRSTIWPRFAQASAELLGQAIGTARIAQAADDGPPAFPFPKDRRAGKVATVLPCRAHVAAASGELRQTR
jgi:hypothetical protein